MSRAFSNLRQDRRGVTSLEFGIVAVLLLSLIIASMDLGRYYIITTSLRALVQEAARSTLAICSTSVVNCTAQVTVGSVSQIVPFLDTSKLEDYSVTFTGGTSTLVVTATASYSFVPFTPLWASLAGKITETSRLSF